MYQQNKLAGVVPRHGQRHHVDDYEVDVHEADVGQQGHVGVQDGEGDELYEGVESHELEHPERSHQRGSSLPDQQRHALDPLVTARREGGCHRRLRDLIG